MQPGEADLGNRARSSSDNQARIPGKRHEQIASIPHAAWNDYSRGPIERGHLIRRDDANDQSASPNRAFGGNPGCRAARPTDYGDAQLRTGGSASSYAADPGSALPRTHTCGRRIEWLIWLGARSVKNATDAHGPLNDR